MSLNLRQVEVCGIAPTWTEEIIQLLYGNKQLSGGGSIQCVELDCITSVSFSQTLPTQDTDC